MEELEKYLRAIMLLQVQTMQASDQHFQPEVALARAGFQYVEIAKLINKEPNAIRMTVNRAQSKKTARGRGK